LATEAGKVYPRGSVPAATPDRLAFESPEDVAESLRRYDLTTHPSLQRLRRSPDGAARALAVVHAAQDAIARHAGLARLGAPDAPGWPELPQHPGAPAPDRRLEQCARDLEERLAPLVHAEDELEALGALAT